MHRLAFRLALATLVLTAPAGRLAAQGAPTTPGSATRLGVALTVLPLLGGGALMVSAADGDDDRVGIGYAIASAGVILGPAVGNWVGGLGGRGWRGAGIRTALAWGGLATAFALCGLECRDETGADVVFAVTSAAAVAHAAWDLATLGNRIERKRGLRMALGPVWVPSARRPGLGVTLRF